MEGKELVIKQLDLLVEMAEYCTNKERPKDSLQGKCSNCALSWTFNLGNHGCLLVKVVDDNEQFMNDLMWACISNEIEYKDKFNKIASIFDTECDE